jgi:hypothetical protein
MGSRMERMVKGPRNRWQRLTAGILVLALVLQGIAFTLAGARVAAADPTDAAASFFLCRHDGGLGGGGPPKSPASDRHCIFCLTEATYLDAPAAASAYHTITFGVLSWSLSAWRLSATTVNASARPRGPPLPA